MSETEDDVVRVEAERRALGVKAGFEATLSALRANIEEEVEEGER